jgi:hypothetical protein
MTMASLSLEMISLPSTMLMIGVPALPSRIQGWRCG